MGLFKDYILRKHEKAKNNPKNSINKENKHIAGFVINNKGARGLGHAGLFAQQDDGQFVFYELTGISQKSNGLDKDAKKGDVLVDTWGNETKILSNLPLLFPRPKVANLLGFDGNAGILKRKFKTFQDMKIALKHMRFRAIITFATSAKQDSVILKNAEKSGSNFRGYNLLRDSCGTFAINSLTGGDSGVDYLNTRDKIVFPFSDSIPNIIGVNLILSNHSSSLTELRK